MAIDVEEKKSSSGASRNSRKNKNSQSRRPSRISRNQYLYPKPHISDEDTGRRSVIEKTNSVLKAIAKRQ
ncbi:hypothetical protein [Radiobacillus sp. PE A8.2]|uniref:hypothetical protein n=1 Tax=Radiobacillus sp. PE A8.2 TaxID=3380349 RepID=UPI0038901171